MRIKNISPLGDVDVPLLGRIVEAGEIIDVSPEEAEQLVLQEANWQATDAEAKKLRDKLSQPAQGDDEAVPGSVPGDAVNDTQEPAQGSTEAVDGQKGE